MPGRIGNSSSKFSTYDANYKLTDPRSSMSSKNKKHAETTPRHIIIKFFKTNDKILTAAKGKNLERICKKEHIKITDEHRKRYVTFLVIREMQNKAW